MFKLGYKSASSENSSVVLSLSLEAAVVLLTAVSWNQTRISLLPDH